MAQHYSHEDDLNLINGLVPAFRDDRYIRVNGKPLFLVYRTHLMPDPKKSAEIWREAMHKAGIGEIYLVCIDNHMDGGELNPETIGFDASVEFAPNWGMMGPKLTHSMNVFPEFSDSNPKIFDYEHCMLSMLGRKQPPYKLFRGVFPSWDNSARRKQEPLLFINSSPEKYAFWLSQVARQTLLNFDGDERLLFINAWNEWGEGCHLEPDEKYGMQYLEATRSALHLAEDMHAAVACLGESTASLSFDPEQWGRLLTDCYAAKSGLSDDEVRTLAAFSPYVLFTMMPLVDDSVRKQFEAVIQSREQVIKDLHESLSWRITAPLRKLYDVIFHRL